MIKSKTVWGAKIDEAFFRIDDFVNELLVDCMEYESSCMAGSSFVSSLSHAT